jgi:hypothetical protein
LALTAATYHNGMSAAWTRSQLAAELGALEASVDRARSALACVFANSEEFEAAVVRAQRARGAFDPWDVARMRAVLGLTAVLGLVLALLLI